MGIQCIPHDLLASKLHAYGLTEDAVSLCIHRKQGTKINGTESVFQMFLSCIPEGSILGPILFNILMNALFFFIFSRRLTCNFYR